jgi:hypothetical protein
MGDENLHWKEIETRPVSVGNIHIVDRIMSPTKTRVDAMARSLSGPLGQLQPILVTKYLHSAWKVVTGATRLLPAKQLGWKQIRATIVSADNDIEYRLIEIAENLDRHDLSKTERAQLKAKNKELHAQRLAEFERQLTENDAPKAKGGRGKKGGVRDAARKAGVPLATAQRRIGKPTQNESWVTLDSPANPRGNDSMRSTASKENLEARLNEIDVEIEGLRDRIAELVSERGRVADRLDELVGGQ